ncbi:MAG: seg [Candidatus Taylorbacteria bacterium]|nr:seg [Candidatus Taylorbacteria bacterium]
MEILEKIFGSATKARLMRSFVYNPDTVFDINFLAKKIKARAGGIKKEINLLEKAGLIKRRATKNENGRSVNGVILNQNFKYLEALREFLLKVSPLTDEILARKLSLAGRVRLVVVAGVFINAENSRLDMLIVSDRPDEKKLKKILVEIESEFAREISYSLMSADDFKYRLSMGDKLVRDVFDFSHRVVLNKIGLSE